MYVKISTPPDTKTGFCPYLGLRNDPETCLGYPSEWNLCYRARPVAAVNQEQQREMCLSPVYRRCPVFQRERAAPLPRQFRGPRPLLKRGKVLLALCLILVALVAWALWYYGPQGVLALLGSMPF